MSSTKTKSGTVRLTDIQLILLSRASQHPDHQVILPDHLNERTGAKALQGLEQRGLAVCDASSSDSEDGSPARPSTYRITPAGLTAIGVTDTTPTAPVSLEATKTGAKKAQKRTKAVGKTRRPSPRGAKAKAPKTQKGQAEKSSKQATLIALLKRPKGASLQELVTAAGWQAHSIRGFLSGTIKSKLGLKLDRTNDTKRGSSYRIVD